ncbi:MarR family winged helix-turn-helix transcriptional regulator [Methylobacterium planeticum]|uniref:Winged helix-turn-helix transcriptional regulator n=1 Tax=Methylobacterium planeticum TaxID=2615211 RepID=A0A6N6MJK2_9HYPH|nr:MarR family winged helix-turn-helix transcriptional regulator [Methylobacterium planeticum]KAB1070671.1 winged helix-turn-helix transcriptional regulator [Methylobacterium planeticum]
MGRATKSTEVRAPAPVLTDVIDPQVYVPALLTTLSNSLTRNASTFYRRHFGVGITDWRIMYRLSSEPWVTAHHICNAAQLDKGVVSRSLAWMETRGLVLVRGDETDARRRLVALSPAGLDLHGRITKVALERERNFLAPLSEEERAATVRLLTKLIGNLRAFSKPVAIPPAAPAPAKAAAEISPAPERVSARARAAVP